MIRTHHPLRITAGKIIPLTMATFCKIVFNIFKKFK
ncbi:hypothetical protein PUN28_019408 [Cardiocondyla obscurior]|uniref:Uncharacterized protein n=1 Tax=Cardiocondyla obscurior TaxID=286306 RepID=A0AAW2EGT2_9HYME